MINDYVKISDAVSIRINERTATDGLRCPICGAMGLDVIVFSESNAKLWDQQLNRVHLCVTHYKGS